MTLTVWNAGTSEVSQGGIALMETLAILILIVLSLIAAVVAAFSREV